MLSDGSSPARGRDNSGKPCGAVVGRSCVGAWCHSMEWDAISIRQRALGVAEWVDQLRGWSRWRVLISTRPRSSAAGCSTSAISRLAMKPAGSHRRPGAGHLANLDHAARGDDLDPPARLGGHDLERLDALSGVDHGFDPITLHGSGLVSRISLSRSVASISASMVFWTALPMSSFLIPPRLSVQRERHAGPFGDLFQDELAARSDGTRDGHERQPAVRLEGGHAIVGIDAASARTLTPCL